MLRVDCHAVARWTVAFLTCLLPQLRAAEIDCLDSVAALDYWRPIQQRAATSDKPPDPLAIELISCLSSPVAELRDQIGYELFTSWLRNDRLSDETRATLLVRLSEKMNTPPTDAEDNTALSRSFSALILAELMRSDALVPFMNARQRQTLLANAVAALERETDFRGLDAEVGWVHPVAHMSDLLWRFALHPATSPAQAELVLDAITAKVAPTTAFYNFNESDRLARVVTTILRRELVDAGRVVEWLAAFESPHSMQEWSSAFSSREGMAELHNTKQFLRALSDQLAGTQSDPRIIQQLEELVESFTQMV